MPASPRQGVLLFAVASATHFAQLTGLALATASRPRLRARPRVRAARLGGPLVCASVDAAGERLASAPREAVALLDALRRLLAASAGEGPRVTLAAELEAATAYLELERVRRGSSPRWRVSADPRAYRLLVPRGVVTDLVDRSMSGRPRALELSIRFASADALELRLRRRDASPGRPTRVRSRTRRIALGEPIPAARSLRQRLGTLASRLGSWREPSPAPAGLPRDPLAPLGPALLVRALDRVIAAVRSGNGQAALACLSECVRGAADSAGPLGEELHRLQRCLELAAAPIRIELDVPASLLRRPAPQPLPLRALADRLIRASGGASSTIEIASRVEDGIPRLCVRALRHG